MKYPLFINGGLYNNGQPMTKSAALKVARAAYGPTAQVVRTEGVEGGVYSVQWRVIV